MSTIENNEQAKTVTVDVPTLDWKIPGVDDFDGGGTLDNGMEYWDSYVYVRKVKCGGAQSSNFTSLPTEATIRDGTYIGISPRIKGPHVIIRLVNGYWQVMDVEHAMHVALMLLSAVEMMKNAYKPIALGLYTRDTLVYQLQAGETIDLIDGHFRVLDAAKQQVGPLYAVSLYTLQPVIAGQT